ncbi:MAG TPA: amino acid permease [Clostridium sp.]|uniref:amino acid permease n=1 Tax=Clostridium sp. TaxID=1506 RepID=UPI002F921B9E
MGNTKYHDFIKSHSWQSQPLMETKVKKKPNNPMGRLTLLGLTMLGLGGAIGSGIFVASGLAINQAGPAIILTFIIGGIISTLVMTMLGEMCANEPTSGSFSFYAGEYLGPALGFISGWIYWLAGILTLSTEMVAAALITRFWLPTWPIWLISLIIVGVIVGISFLNVRAFARVEEILSFIKVGILLVIIASGVAVFSRIWPGIKSPGVSNYVIHGGFFPHGLKGAFSSLLLVLYAYAGEQVIGPAAGDTRNPQKTIPQAVRLINFILIILYIGAITTLVGLVHWYQVPLNGSGFIFLFDNLGVPAMTHIMSAVILSAILSAMNSNMYGVPRMLKSLAERHDAPAFMAKIKQGGMPITAVLISSTFLLIVVGISYLLPQNIFVYIASASGVTILLNWLVIALTYVRFRRYSKTKQGNQSEQSFGFPYAAATAIVLLLMALATSAMSSNQLVGLVVGISLVLLLTLFHFFLARRSRLRGSKNSHK